MSARTKKVQVTLQLTQRDAKRLDERIRECVDEQPKTEIDQARMRSVVGTLIVRQTLLMYEGKGPLFKAMLRAAEKTAKISAQREPNRRRGPRSQKGDKT